MSDKHYWRNERGDMLWSEQSADAMDAAIETIYALFQKDLKRNPTVSELLAGLELAITVKERMEADEGK